MRPENSRGTPVDPVPFLVVAALGFLFCYSFGPACLMALGAELAGGLGNSTMAFLAVAELAYYRFVWTAGPDLREEVPGEFRFQRLVLGVLAILALPLLHVRPWW